MGCSKYGLLLAWIQIIFSTFLVFFFFLVNITKYLIKRISELENLKTWTECAEKLEDSSVSLFIVPFYCWCWLCCCHGRQVSLCCKNHGFKQGWTFSSVLSVWADAACRNCHGTNPLGNVLGIAVPKESKVLALEKDQLEDGREFENGAETFPLTSRGSSFNQTHGHKWNCEGYLEVCSIPSITGLICPTYPSVLLSDPVNCCYFLFLRKKWCWIDDLEDTNSWYSWYCREGRHRGMAAWGLLFHSGELVRVEKGRQAVLGSWELIQRMLGFCFSLLSDNTASSQFSHTISQLKMFQHWLLRALLQFLEADVLNSVAGFLL